MTARPVLSRPTRYLLVVLLAIYIVTGFPLFVAPVQSSTQFAWTVSPLVAMTIGGWCLGNAWVALVAMRRRRWDGALGAVVYLAVFGFLETGVLVAFRQRIMLAGVLAWFYVLALIASCLFALVCVIDWARQKPVLVIVGRRLYLPERTYLLLFIAFVGFLGLYGLLAPIGSRGLHATIFPEQLSMFSLRSFGAFYLSLAVGTVPLLLKPGLGNSLSHAYTFAGLIVFITAAALVFIDQFDFAGRPTQATYLAVYLTVGLINGVYLLRHGSGSVHPLREGPTAQALIE